MLTENCAERLGKTRKLGEDTLLRLRYCLLCNSEVVSGFFVIENLLTRPLPPLMQRNSARVCGVRLKTAVPRLCCLRCGAEYAKRNRVTVQTPSLSVAQPLSVLFETFLQNKTSFCTANTVGLQSRNAEEETFFQMLGNQLQLETPESSVDELSSVEQKAQTASVLEKGFLVVSHLVRLSLADQAGLRLGDVVLKFGPFTSDNFDGFESLVEYTKKTAENVLVVVARKKEDGGETVVVEKDLYLDLRNNESKKGALGVVLKRFNHTDGEIGSFFE